MIRKRDEFLQSIGSRRVVGSRRSMDPEKTTLAEYLPDWLQNAARGNNGASSFEPYGQAVRIQLIPLLGAVTLAEINVSDVRYLKESLLDEGLAPDTVAYVQGVLSTALNQAVSDRLSIRRAVVVRGGEERLTLPKDGEEPAIRLGPKLVKAFQEHRKLQAEARLARDPGGAWEHPDLIFTGKAGMVIRDSTLHDQFKRILRSAELPEIRLHDLRHTAATLMLKNKVDVRTVAEILGHQDPAMTLRKYAHVLSDMQDDAASRMDEVLS